MRPRARPLALLWALLLALPWATAAAAPPRVELNVPYVEQPRGPFCVAAAAVMVARFHGRPLDVKPLARTLTVHADGIAWLELVEALPAHGLEGLLFQGEPAQLRMALDAGLPVIAVMRDGATRHAWVVRGYGPDGWQVLDPAEPGLRRVDPATLDARWTGGLVVIRPADRPPPAGVPWDAWRLDSDRSRAEGWLKRALGRPPSDALALLDHGLRIDPTHIALHLQKAALLGELGRGAEACAATRDAWANVRDGGAHLDDAQRITREVARKLGCEPPDAHRRAVRAPSKGSSEAAAPAPPAKP